MTSVLTAGETMLALVPDQPGRLRNAGRLTTGVAGSESNVAIGLSRLGVACEWVSALGTDEIGQLVLNRIRGEGVATSHVHRDPTRPTGVLFRERVGRHVNVHYQRRGSAASAMAPGMLEPGWIADAGVVHLSGITPALSPSCRDFTTAAMRDVRRIGTLLSFDVNYRSKLWSADAARAWLDDVLPLVDLLFVSEEEGRALWGAGGAELLDVLATYGCGQLVLKRGRDGSCVRVHDVRYEQPAYPVPEVDPVGAGDAFAAGYLAGHVWGAAPQERLRLGNAMGACAVAAIGDYDALPDRTELEELLSGTEGLRR